MAVGFDAASESHTGTTGSTSQASFSWTHTPAGTPKGVLVFTFNATSSTDITTSVTYGGVPLKAVSGGRAVDSAGEPGDCEAWFLNGYGHGPTGVWMPPPTSPPTDAWYQAAYGSDGNWVAAGVNGVIRAATDPHGTWSLATSGTTNTFFGVAYGNGKWVAVGASGMVRHATSPSGTWTAATSPGFATSQVNGVAYGNGYWVAVAASGKIRYATDPTGTWTAATSPGFGTEAVTGVAYGNGYWVAVGSTGTIRYATDPTGTWSASSGGGTSLERVRYLNGYWLAGGLNNLRYATDPTSTWSAAASHGFGAVFIYEFTYLDPYWFASGESSQVRYATDPTGTWSAVESMSSSGELYRGLATDGNKIMAAGNTTIRAASNAAVGLPTGAQTVAVSRSNTADVMYATAITVTAAAEVETTGVVLQQGDLTLAATKVSDGSPGTNSMRFAGLNSGLAAPPALASGTTSVADIDFGQRVVSVVRETAASQGDGGTAGAGIGWTAGGIDDVAAVYLAVREIVSAAFTWTSVGSVAT